MSLYWEWGTVTLLALCYHSEIQWAIIFRENAFILSWIWRFQSKTKCSHCLARQWGSTWWQVRWSKNSHLLSQEATYGQRTRAGLLILLWAQLKWPEFPGPIFLKVPPPSNIKHTDLCGHYPPQTLTSPILFSVIVQLENHSSRSAWVMHH